MGVLWIIFCSTTDKKKIKRNNYQILFSKLDIHKIYFKKKLPFLNMKKQNKTKICEKTKEEEKINKNLNFII